MATYRDLVAWQRAVDPFEAVSLATKRFPSEERSVLTPQLRRAALSATLRRETMMAAAHGADTPVWRVVAHVPWSRVAGHAAGADLVVWIADDWEEADGEPARDSNGHVLVRAAAVDGPSIAWAEALCGRDPDGRVRPRHMRLW